MTPQLGKVFVSSVFGGMMDLRQLAADAARLLGFEVVLTEKLVNQPSAVASVLAREIEQCDLYVGLFDRRRGTVPPTGTKDARAITEEELRIARERGLRCLVFLSKLDSKDREPGLADFLEREVTDYATGVWTRPYDSPESLRRDLVAALAARRPRVVLALEPAPPDSGLQARLFLEGAQPAWQGEAVLGPVPVDLALQGDAREIVLRFLSDSSVRGRFTEEALRWAGGELAKRALPGPLFEAVEEVLTLAAHGGLQQLVTLEVRTGDQAALALPWDLLSFPRQPLPVRLGLLEVVRRILRPGEDADPTLDAAAQVPPENLSILGFTAAPFEDTAEVARLGTGGFADSDLFWEQEQERLLAALDDLLRTRRGRLVLPDTGDVDTLRAQLARKDRPRVLHFSCHGGARGPKNPEPVLLLENAEGFRATVGATDLLGWLRSAAPGAGTIDLVILSACSTANAPALGGSLPGPPGHRGPVAEAHAVERAAAGFAEALVRGGVPRVIGMQGYVSDAAATAFAGDFYAALSKGVDLPMALRAGRTAMAAKGNAHEWAVPALTASRAVGPLTSPEGSFAPVDTPFEEVSEVFRIAGVSYLEEGYVGRREMERRLRTAFEKDRILVIHGLGGIGKSTLAARFLARQKVQGAEIIVLGAGRELSATTLIEEVAREVEVARPAGLTPEAAEKEYRDSLGRALRKVDPTILLLDNFEDNQKEDGQPKDFALGEALVDLAILAGPALRILLTSRLALKLPSVPVPVTNLDLGELSRSGCRKLRLLDPAGLGRIPADAWEQVLLHLGGHPKALELLKGYVRGGPDRAHALLEHLGRAVDHVDEALRANQQERGRSLLVETVLSEVPDKRRPTFDRLCLLELPLPSAELEKLLAEEGVAHPAEDLAWLRDRGLLASKIADSALSGGDAVHRLLAQRQKEALSEREGPEAAKAWHLRVAEHLVERPGALSDFGVAARHRDAAGDRAGALGLYYRWATALRDQHAYAACGQVVFDGLSAFPTGNSEAERTEGARLLLRGCDGLLPLGKVHQATAVLGQALGLVQKSESSEARFVRGSALLRIGRQLVQDGKPKEAEETLVKALEDFEAGDHKRDRAVTLGDIARLRAQGGDIAGALKLHEEMLGIFEQVGDVRERAVTLGDIARLRAQGGDIAGALKLHEEELKVYEQVGDVRSRAVTLYDLAQLDLKHEKVAQAIPRLAECFKLCQQVGYAQGVAIAGQSYGSLLADTDPAKARAVLQAAREKLQLLGMADEIAEIDALLKKLGS